MKPSGYYRFPTIHKDTIAFIAEDDIWSVPITGGAATRLTSNLAPASRPYFSPDGKWLAFTGFEEGNPEVYLMPAQGGVENRLTYTGALTMTIGWSREGQSILFISNLAQPFPHVHHIYQVSPQGGNIKNLNYGHAHSISFGKKGVVLGRNTLDSARWKRYRGGTKGVLWVDSQNRGNFKKLNTLEGNIDTPMWIGERIYFLSDHEGIGGLYSCNSEGKHLQKHFLHQEFYARNAQTDGQKIIFQVGAEIAVYDLQSQKTEMVTIIWNSPRVQRNRKFVAAHEYLDSFSLHPEGHSTVITTRGKLFSFGNWEGPVLEIKPLLIGRYRLAKWLSDKKYLVTLCDQDGEEILEKHSLTFNSRITRYNKLDLGRTTQLEVSPKEDKIALSNHRNELILVDLKRKTSKILDTSPFSRIEGFAWSPDGDWIAYSCAETQETFSIKLYHVSKQKNYRITEQRFIDVRPSFDPEGKYLYFISYRYFDPVYDRLFFDLNFPKGSRPFLISLQATTESPFVQNPKPLQELNPKKEDSPNKKNSASPEKISIDLKGIEKRIEPFPVPEGNYTKILGLRKKALFTSEPNEGALSRNSMSTEPSKKGTLQVYDFEKRKTDVVATEVTQFALSLENETLIYRSGRRLRVMLVEPKDDKKQKASSANRENGWLDLGRAKVLVDPVSEWKQMLREIWRLQREHFWTEDMSGVDWENVFQRYTPLVEKVGSRTEFSDLVWEMQGELGTSHAYEMGGDYRNGPRYTVGKLGADFKYDTQSGQYTLAHIVQGDAWVEKENSPLNRLGVNLKEGDVLVAINGEKVGKNKSPHELLLHRANTEVALTFQPKRRKGLKEVLIKTLSDETKARYREWVENNHRQVEKLTKGLVGYLHIPNMGPWGYSEFHRYYRTEVEKDALIVDVRYNGGGHVSQLILEKLARRRLGNNVSRWGQFSSYPQGLIEGPLVALTNEYAGSDGDIFCHGFKLLELGILIGTRTWGGVIGISPRHSLVDRTLTTQPEYSFWFTDVEWGVENYGTDPQIEVDIRPQDWKKEVDPQLDKSIEVILKELKKNPVKNPKFDNRPRLGPSRKQKRAK